MCGITGFWHSNSGDSNAALLERVGRMMEALKHRGPDGAGSWADERTGLALAARRLAIVDTSDAGAQPMLSASGTKVLVFNGEIYNHVALRRELEHEGVSVAPGSDTAVLLAAIEQWGITDALKKTTGMFALACWDARKRELWLARDRLGEKPLYYARLGGAFVFGSELRALREHPAWRAEVSADALDALLRFNYIPGEQSVFRGITRLRPGHTLCLRESDLSAAAPPVSQAYWSFAEIALDGERRPWQGGFDGAMDEVERLMIDALGTSMSASVPAAISLSGGLDSSLLAALAVRAGIKPLRTLTVGFDEPDYDESAHARDLAARLGTEHHETTLTGADARDLVPQLAEIYDEPLADFSQFPACSVARLARDRGVKVLISGEGCDELFGGYRLYGDTLRAHRRWSFRPRWLSGILKRVAGRGHAAATARELYLQSLRRWDRPHPLLLRHDSSRALDQITDAPDMRKDAHWMMALDTVAYLPDDLLVKMDRATMWYGVENRATLLSHPIVEFAWRLPVQWKVDGGAGKYILRQLAKRHLPEAWLARKKRGFTPPLGHWLRGPLREWAESLLSESALNDTGLIATKSAREIWRRHLNGPHDREQEFALWSILTLQSWARRWKVSVNSGTA